MSNDLRLELLRETHAATLFALLRDPELWRYCDGEPPASQAALAARFRHLETRRSPDGSQAWLNWVVMVADRATGFVQATVTGEIAQIAYVIGRKHQSRAIATRAVTEMLVILEQDYGVREFQATVDARNEPSLRLLTRLHFSLVDDSAPESLRYSKTL
ncbi:MAG TPA: GNAT family N-acetyltransferase [Candidatus Acidoferrales bacterium]|nr:GNAT family N-acetyltransferase [Candidatus Acidoferrales bacterium]